MYCLHTVFRPFWMEILSRFVKLWTLHWYGVFPVWMAIWVFSMHPFKKHYVAYYIIIFSSSMVSLSQHESPLYGSVRKLLTIMLCCIIINGFRCGWLSFQLNEAWLWNRIANLHGSKGRNIPLMSSSMGILKMIFEQNMTRCFNEFNYTT